MDRIRKLPKKTTLNLTVALNFRKNMQKIHIHANFNPIISLFQCRIYEFHIKLGENRLQILKFFVTVK